MTKTIPYLLFIIITTTIISTLFGSYIKNFENFVYRHCIRLFYKKI